MTPKTVGRLASYCVFFAYLSCHARNAEEFNYPLGYPSGYGYSSSKDQGGNQYLENIFISSSCGSISHPGEDWNAIDYTWTEDKNYGHDGNDAHDPIYAIAHGVIEEATYLSSSDGTKDAGYAIQIKHTGDFLVPYAWQAVDDPYYSYPTLSNDHISIVWSVYIHLESIALNPHTSRKWTSGDEISGGEIIGSVGDYPHESGRSYHLHFEVRQRKRNVGFLPCHLEPEDFNQIYMKPTHFIRLNRCKPESIPPPNYELPNECLGECCLYTPGSGFRWEALQDTPVFPRRDINSQPFSSILTGEKFIAETGVLVTKTPGFVKISFDLTQDCQSIGLEDGECISVLAPWSEGYYHLWHQDDFVGGCFIAPDVEPTVDWWVYVRKSNGQTGWILYGYGFNFCYSHPCYEDRPECLD